MDLFLNSFKCINVFSLWHWHYYVLYTQLAFSFGGDTDTIGNMAGAMAGAHLGFDKLPKDLYTICQGYEEALDKADKLFSLNRMRMGQAKAEFQEVLP